MVGAAIRGAIDAGDVRREELWITSKLWCNVHGRDNVEGALRRTLADLRLDWLDLYLIHWPVPIKPGLAFPSSGGDLLPLAQVPLADTWKGMEAALEAGLTPADLAQIAGLDQHRRLVDGAFWLLEGSPWSLQSLWDEG